MFLKLKNLFLKLLLGHKTILNSSDIRMAFPDYFGGGQAGRLNWFTRKYNIKRAPKDSRNALNRYYCTLEKVRKCILIQLEEKDVGQMQPIIHSGLVSGDIFKAFPKFFAQHDKYNKLSTIAKKYNIPHHRVPGGSCYTIDLEELSKYIDLEIEFLSNTLTVREIFKKFEDRFEGDGQFYSFFCKYRDEIPHTKAHGKLCFDKGAVEVIEGLIQPKEVVVPEVKKVVQLNQAKGKMPEGVRLLMGWETTARHQLEATAEIDEIERKEKEREEELDLLKLKKEAMQIKLATDDPQSFQFERGASYPWACIVQKYPFLKKWREEGYGHPFPEHPRGTAWKVGFADGHLAKSCPLISFMLMVDEKDLTELFIDGFFEDSHHCPFVKSAGEGRYVVSQSSDWWTMLSWNELYYRLQSIGLMKELVRIKDIPEMLLQHHQFDAEVSDWKILGQPLGEVTHWLGHMIAEIMKTHYRCDRVGARFRHTGKHHQGNEFQGGFYWEDKAFVCTSKQNIPDFLARMTQLVVEEAKDGLNYPPQISSTIINLFSPNKKGADAKSPKEIHLAPKEVNGIFAHREWGFSNGKGKELTLAPYRLNTSLDKNCHVTFFMGDEKGSIEVKLSDLKKEHRNEILSYAKTQVD